LTLAASLSRGSWPLWALGPRLGGVRQSSIVSSAVRKWRWGEFDEHDRGENNSCTVLECDCMSRLALHCLIVLASFGSLSSQPISDQTACGINRNGVRLPCPAGWQQLKSDGRETVIGNFAPTPENRDRMSGPGMATITVMAKTYKDVAQWVWVAKKGSPELIEKRFKLTNQAVGEITVVSLESTEESGPVFMSYLFELKNTPVLVEVVHRATDPQKAAYRTAAMWMIERAVADRK